MNSKTNYFWNKYTIVPIIVVTILSISIGLYSAYKIDKAKPSETSHSYAFKLESGEVVVCNRYWIGSGSVDLYGCYGGREYYGMRNVERFAEYIDGKLVEKQ